MSDGVGELDTPTTEHNRKHCQRKEARIKQKSSSIKGPGTSMPISLLDADATSTGEEFCKQIQHEPPKQENFIYYKEKKVYHKFKLLQKLVTKHMF